MNNDLFNKVKDTGKQVSNHIGKNIKQHTAIGQKYSKMEDDTSYDNVMDFAKELASIAKTARTTYNDWSNQEYHAPGYSFVGPGTKAQERVDAGILPINKTDESGRLHDLTFAEIGKRKKKENLSDRQVRDLVRQADERFISDLGSYEDEKDNFVNKSARFIIRAKTIADDLGMTDPTMFLD
jgi:hypothetical protein